MNTTTMKTGCKWTISKEEALSRITNGEGAPCYIRVGDLTEHYYVSRHPYEAGVWYVSKEIESGELIPYTVDTNWSKWTCDHNQVCGFSQVKIAYECKHCRALRALLKVIGVEA